MTNLLFVYGSLMPALTNSYGIAERTRLKSESTTLGPATLAATLYDLGQYPGIVLPNAVLNETRVVHGTVLRLSNPDHTFAWLDPFEYIEPGQDPALALYARVIQTVECVGADAQAWVYVLRRVPPGSLVVTLGKWHAPSP